MSNLNVIKVVWNRNSPRILWLQYEDGEWVYVNWIGPPETLIITTLPIKTSPETVPYPDDEVVYERPIDLSRRSITEAHRSGGNKPTPYEMFKLMTKDILDNTGHLHGCGYTPEGTCPCGKFGEDLFSIYKTTLASYLRKA